MNDTITKIEKNWTSETSNTLFSCASCVNQNRLMCCLDKDEDERLTDRKKMFSFKKREYIFRESMTPKGLFCVKSGIVKVFKHRDDGREQIVFYKIRQKPGKPLFFGKIKKKHVFALPGNPASALNNFYIYVLPALKKLSGFSLIHLKTARYPLAKCYENKSEDSDQFLKATVKDNKIHILDGQSSSMLLSFGQANALAFIQSGAKVYSKNDLIKVFLI